MKGTPPVLPAPCRSPIVLLWFVANAGIGERLRARSVQALSDRQPSTRALAAAPPSPNSRRPSPRRRSSAGAYNLATYGAGALRALSPHYVYYYWTAQPLGQAWRGLGAILLCVTGAEALYADMGHFSARSIRVRRHAGGAASTGHPEPSRTASPAGHPAAAAAAPHAMAPSSLQLSFLAVVYPALALTYLGQTAVVVARPEAAARAYWASVPAPLLWPAVVLATLAAVIASQALITGSFSIVQQARALAPCAAPCHVAPCPAGLLLASLLPPRALQPCN